MRKNTKNLSKPSAKNIKFPLSRSIPTWNWANGQDFANSTKTEKLARSSNAQVASLKIGEKNHQHLTLLRITLNLKSNLLYAVIEINELVITS